MLQRNKMMGLAAAACTLLGMGASEAVVTFSWQESGGNVLLSVAGTLDVTGWTSSSANTNLSTAIVSNFSDPMFGDQQEVQVLGSFATASSVMTVDVNMVLSPWASITGAEVAGSRISGASAFDLRVGTSGGAYIPTSQVIGNTVTINDQYMFSGQTLDGMFGSGYSWGGGAHIATIGGNQVNFEVVPEPSSSLLLAGSALVFATSRRRKRHA